MDFCHVIHGTTCNRKSNAIQNPKLTYPLRGNNADKRVYQTNSRRKRTEKSGTATLLVCGPPVIYQEPDGRGDKTNFQIFPRYQRISHSMRKKTSGGGSASPFRMSGCVTYLHLPHTSSSYAYRSRRNSETNLRVPGRRLKS